MKRKNSKAIKPAIQINVEAVQVSVEVHLHPPKTSGGKDWTALVQAAVALVLQWLLGNADFSVI